MKQEIKITIENMCAVYILCNAIAPINSETTQKHRNLWERYFIFTNFIGNKNDTPATTINKIKWENKTLCGLKCTKSFYIIMRFVLHTRHNYEVQLTHTHTHSHHTVSVISIHYLFRALIGPQWKLCESLTHGVEFMLA